MASSLRFDIALVLSLWLNDALALSLPLDIADASPPLHLEFVDANMSSLRFNFAGASPQQFNIVDSSHLQTDLAHDLPLQFHIAELSPLPYHQLRLCGSVMKQQNRLIILHVGGEFCHHEVSHVICSNFG
jgi:hypothetical protein